MGYEEGFSSYNTFIFWVYVMLKVNNIEVVYSSVILSLRGVSLEVPDERISALLGANGAGKTTTLNAISCLLKPELGEVTHGSIEFDGVRIDRKSPQEVSAMGISQVMEGRELYEHLSVEENLRLGAYLLHGRDVLKKQFEMAYYYFPKLNKLKNKVSGYLSGGEQQMLVIGRSLMGKPKLMLVDEASLGLAPLLIKSLFEAINQINKEEKIAILLVEQNANIALKVASYAYVMENGRIVMDDTAEKLRNNEDIKEFYLGLGTSGKRSFRDIKHYRRRKRWL